MLKGVMATKRQYDGQLPRREKFQRREAELHGNSINSFINHGNLSVNGVEAEIPSRSIKSRAIFVLENASLHIGIVRKKRKILSSGEDEDFLARQGKNLNDYRPDIFYEALRAILDSPLNKAGMVGALYVKTNAGVLFEVKPHTRIPRTCKRFCGIMLELLQNSCVRAKDTREALIQTLKGPLTTYIPENARVIGLSYSSQKVVDIENYLAATSDDSNLVFVVGTMVHGKVAKDSTDDYISVSDYPLSAKCSVGLVCEALEQKWHIF